MQITKLRPEPEGCRVFAFQEVIVAGSLERLIATDLKHNPPTIEERLNAMGAELVDWLDVQHKTVGVTPELRDAFERYSFLHFQNTGQASPNERN